MNTALIPLRHICCLLRHLRPLDSRDCECSRGIGWLASHWSYVDRVRDLVTQLAHGQLVTVNLAIELHTAMRNSGLERLTASSLIFCYSN